MSFKKGLRLQYKQESNHGCSLYCLANFFNNDDFLKFLDPKYRKRYYGMDPDAENSILKRLEYKDFRVVDLIHINHGYGYMIPKSLFSHAIEFLGKTDDGRRWMTPYLLSVKRNRHASLMHRIYVIVDKYPRKIRYHVLDPLVGHMMSTTNILDIYNKYKRVQDVSAFFMKFPREHVIINQEYCKYLIDE